MPTLGTLLQAVCSRRRGRLRAAWGCPPWHYALAKSALYLVLAIPVILAWWQSKRRLQAKGFAWPIWRAGIWLLVAFTIWQIGLVLSRPLIGEPIKCPYERFGSKLSRRGSRSMGCIAFTLGRGNKGSFTRFLLLIVGPLFGEIALIPKKRVLMAFGSSLRSSIHCRAIRASCVHRPRIALHSYSEGSSCLGRPVSAWRWRSLPAGGALAWGRDGHHVIGDIANRYLDPKAASEVRQLLTIENGHVACRCGGVGGRVPRGRIATPRRGTTSTSRSRTPRTRRRATAGRKTCLVAKLDEFRRKLADKSLPPEQRLEALKFVVHFVGDIHQPLHCANNGDKGGNDVKVIYRGTHDRSCTRGVGQRHHPRGGHGGARHPAKLAAKITDGDLKRWQRGEEVAWANESYRVAKTFIYIAPA